MVTHYITVKVTVPDEEGFLDAFGPLDNPLSADLRVVLQDDLVSHLEYLGLEAEIIP